MPLPRRIGTPQETCTFICFIYAYLSKHAPAVHREIFAQPICIQMVSRHIKRMRGQLQGASSLMLVWMLMRILLRVLAAFGLRLMLFLDGKA